MVSRDYTKEIGVDSGTRVVSKPVAFAILAIAVVLGSVGLRPLVERAKSPHSIRPAGITQ